MGDAGPVAQSLGMSTWSLEDLYKAIHHDNAMYMFLCAGEQLIEAANVQEFAYKEYAVLTIASGHGLDRRVLAMRGCILANHWKRAAHLLRVDPVSALHAWSELAPEEEPYTLDRNIVRSPRSNQLLQTYRAQLLERPNEHDTSRPTVAIALVNYNMHRHLALGLASIEAQIDDLHEIWLIDDGSTDGSQDLLHDFAKRVPRVSLVTLPHNVGKARAANVAMEQIKADFLLEMDADDWLDPHAVRMIRHQLLTLDDDINLLYGNMRNWRIDARGGYRLTYVQKGEPVRTTQQLATYRFPLGPRVYRTSILQVVGGFPILSFADGRLYEDVALIRELMRVGRIEYRDFTVYNRLLHRESITHQHVKLWPLFVESYLTQ
ncbi:glycosyltransferase family 2 protein [Alicyclobacillus hesperidum]|uniref:glycosyltransferase family 2 protein n=1 Tax=Alicyclobacillus hesperidum TaxID=89784 RepID=UPI0024932106|nr:glycosyltransferase family A protein [Alicyclobacillus hesperidum]